MSRHRVCSPRVQLRHGAVGEGVCGCAWTGREEQVKARRRARAFIVIVFLVLAEGKRREEGVAINVCDGSPAPTPPGRGEGEERGAFIVSVSAFLVEGRRSA